MSRTIRFRAVYKGQMYPVVKLYLGKEKQGVGIDIDGVWFDLYLEEVELMQCTGLKDKNGKDIYEGDIIEMEGATAKVVFWERPPAFGLDYSHNEDAWCDDWTLSDDSERMTVIGNIYEHPDLLKVQP